MNFGSARRVAVMVMTAGLLSAACGELTPPDAFAPTTSSSVVAGVEQETASQVQERPDGQFTGIDEFVPTPAETYIPTLLVSGSRFVLAVDGVASAPLAGSLADLRTVRVVDDLGGGLVSQEQTGEIVYRRAQGSPEPLSSAETGDQLLDVGYWDGSPRALLQVGDAQVDWIQLVTERPGAERDRQAHIQLAEGETIGALAASRDLQAVIVQDSQCGDLRFYDSDGRLINLEGPPPPPCELPSPTYGAVALSPDGGAVAYTIVTYRSDGTEQGTDLVVRELLAGSEFFFSRKIGEEEDSITSLSFDGQRAAYLRRSKVADSSTETVESVTVLDLVSRVESPVDLLSAGNISSVSFARIPVTPAG